MSRTAKLTLQQWGNSLAAFDPAKHGGEVMVSAPRGKNAPHEASTR